MVEIEGYNQVADLATDLEIHPSAHVIEVQQYRRQIKHQPGKSEKLLGFGLPLGLPTPLPI